MSDLIHIDYEKIAADYMESLTTMLRNFQSSGHRFLETWVPDKDDSRSILGMIEAAKDDEVAGIAIHLGQATLARIDSEKLKQAAARFGTLSTFPSGDGLELSLAFLAADGSRIVTAEGTGFGQQAAAVSRRESSAAAEKRKESHPVVLNKGTNPLYSHGLQQAAESRSHEGSLLAKDPLPRVEITVEGLTLSALVDPERNILRKAAYSGADSENLHGLLETLCRFIEGRPLIECHDHSVIFVEYHLRDHSFAPPVPGIVTPENADPMFALPTRLVRELFAEYCRKTGFNNLKNQHDQPISEAWKALSSEERVERISEEVSAHPSGKGMLVLRMESPKRVIVGFAENVKPGAKQGLLIAVEDHLQRTLDRTLQLYVDPKVDQNKRRLREASAI